MQSPSWFNGKAFKIAAICATFSAACANGCAASEGGVVMVAFNLPNEVVTLHEPVYVDLSVQNKLAEPIQIDLGFNRKGAVSVEITDPTGAINRPLRLTEEGIGRIGRLSIGPGSTYKQRLLLNEWYQFSASGKYKLTPQTDDVIKTKSGVAVKRSAPKVLSLEVLPRNEERLKKVCDELAQQALSSQSVEDISSAALALSYVSDPVAISYLGKILEKSPSAVARTLAIEGLRRMAGPDAVGILIANLKKSRDPETSAAIVFALKQIGATTQDQKVKDLIAVEL